MIKKVSLKRLEIGNTLKNQLQKETREINQSKETKAEEVDDKDKQDESQDNDKDEETKPKLNPNAKSFTFNPTAKTFTPSFGGAPTAAAAPPAVAAVLPNPMEYPHGGMHPAMMGNYHPGMQYMQPGKIEQSLFSVSLMLWTLSV